MKIALRDTLRQLALRIKRLRHRLLARFRLFSPETLTQSTRTIRTAQPDEINLPSEFHERSRSYKKKKLASFTTEEIHVCSFSTETTVHDAKFVRLAKHRYLDVGEQTLEPWPTLQKLLAPKPIRRSQTLLVPWGHGGASYGDFIIKLLPKVSRLIDAVPADERQEITVSLPYFSRHQWALDYFGLMGIERHQIVDESITVVVPAGGRLILGSGPKPGHGIAHPQDILSMTRRLAAARPPSTSARSRRLYISRRTGRRMANEAALKVGLLARGFELIELENLSLNQQITMFSEAALIVGPHGAGHANIIWSSPGTHLLEVFHPSWMHPCYALVSQILGLGYSCLVGHEDNKSGAWTEKSRYGIFQNPSIEPEIFFDKIDSIIK